LKKEHSKLRRSIPKEEIVTKSVFYGIDFLPHYVTLFIISASESLK